MTITMLTRWILLTTTMISLCQQSATAAKTYQIFIPSANSHHANNQNRKHQQSSTLSKIETSTMSTNDGNDGGESQHKSAWDTSEEDFYRRRSEADLDDFVADAKVNVYVQPINGDRRREQPGGTHWVKRSGDGPITESSNVGGDIEDEYVDDGRDTGDVNVVGEYMNGGGDDDYDDGFPSGNKAIDRPLARLGKRFYHPLLLNPFDDIGRDKNDDDGEGAVSPGMIRNLRKRMTHALKVYEAQTGTPRMRFGRRRRRIMQETVPGTNSIILIRDPDDQASLRGDGMVGEVARRNGGDRPTARFGKRGRPVARFGRRRRIYGYGGEPVYYSGSRAFGLRFGKRGRPTARFGKRGRPTARFGKRGRYGEQQPNMIRFMNVGQPAVFTRPWTKYGKHKRGGRNDNLYTMLVPLLGEGEDDERDYGIIPFNNNEYFKYNFIG